MGKLFYERVNENGETVLVNMTTTAGLAANAVRTKPGAGKPFLYFNSIPPGVVVGAEFDNAPIATDDVSANAALIAGITALPADVLTYAT